ncbi:pectinesterase family protein [Mangrovibacterium lignilyticum]|uniref:pectinesterase family protein n=1 Tax=Mangrovibacterium lignilyticum TaxID=2668052 RepID=UPI0013D2F877|nr:pectinesterase family protein [Mangrovibacterium lignilyticum]
MKKLHLLLVALMACLMVEAQSLKADFIVDPSGEGDFKTVQEAIDAVPDFRKNETVIFIKNGTYKEKLVLPTSKRQVTFIGEDKMKTIITYDDYAQKKNIFGEEKGTTGSSGFFIFADDFKAANITFENSAGPVGQAVAVRVTGDKISFNNCRFLGNQDTLYPQGDRSRQYYKDCYIEGTVDFIFGWSIAVFDNCEIFCKSSGYVTAASTLETNKYGFVFLNCQITGDAEENSFFLGRPWRPYSNVVYLNCDLGAQIKPEGWNNWGKASNEETAFYAEYNSTGPGSNTTDRAGWSHQLTDEQAQQYSLKNIFSAESVSPAFADDWMPEL